MKYQMKQVIKTKSGKKHNQTENLKQSNQTEVVESQQGLLQNKM